MKQRGRPRIDIAEDVDMNMSTTELVKLLNLSRNRILKEKKKRQILVYRGVPTGTRWSKFREFDWSNTDIVLSKEKGCSREYVRQRRAQAKEPPSSSLEWVAKYHSIPAAL